MPRIALPEGVSIHCAIDDYLVALGGQNAGADDAWLRA